ncbi:WAP, Kazal, immunoglobulin, Kunitz and NTR domain-containing protein Precursor [Channa argus]|nr:WAP, Kazal, immunoglobulin, Kunitz and NTR domain-containing protein Precursor [Channa argus]
MRGVMESQSSPVKSYDYLLKFLLVGDSDVGKGEILDSLQDGSIESPYAYSSGIDYKTSTILLDGRRVKLELWDTSGQGTFSTIFRSYSRGAQGILLVYDITNAWSFDGIDRWMREIDEHAPGVPRILVGNRLHLAVKRQVPTDQARAYAEKNSMIFFEVSPLCNFNVIESFTELSRIVLMRHGMDKFWRPNRAIKSHLKSFSMPNGMNAVMMHGRSYSVATGLASGCSGGGSKAKSIKPSKSFRPPQSPPKDSKDSSLSSKGNFAWRMVLLRKSFRLWKTMWADCADFEKCCTNVCGFNSCVAARFSDGTAAQPGGDAGGEGDDTPTSTATCEGFICSQQGATCDIWDGQPICKCQDRCEKEPNFTCASDGLTYFNRCYMDAEACIRGVTLTVVTCRFYLAGPQTSPLPQHTTAHPTQTSSQEDPMPPTLYSNPHHQSIYVGGTVNFHCDVIGVPRPDVTWEKQSERRERLVMRPDQMYGNVVITNIGQLVIYNAQVWDTGIYTCIARNSAGVLRADYPLSVIRRADDDFSEDPEMPMGRPFSPADCLAEIDLRVCSDERHVDWYYNSKMGSCMAFSNGGCDDSRNRFETYEECKASCQREGMGICSLPAVQGPCKSWEARWAWNSIMKQCQPFAYGGCHGNSNNFHTKKECEANCPQPKRKPCKTCRVKGKMVPSLCQSDFAIVGRLTELVEDLDSGLARFSLEEVLRDEKMGLTFFNTKHLEVTIAKIDWSCPCPNITMEENPFLVMGVVQDGMAMIQSHSYVRTITERRLKKLREAVNKKTCLKM